MTVNANLKRLSLAAPANCVQKKGAKRRWPRSANWLACACGSGVADDDALAVLVIRKAWLASSSSRYGSGARIVPQRLPPHRLQCMQHRERCHCGREVLEAVAGNQVPGGLVDGRVRQLEQPGQYVEEDH